MIRGLSSMLLIPKVKNGKRCHRFHHGANAKANAPVMSFIECHRSLHHVAEICRFHWDICSGDRLHSRPEAQLRPIAQPAKDTSAHQRTVIGASTVEFASESGPELYSLYGWNGHHGMGDHCIKLVEQWLSDSCGNACSSARYGSTDCFALGSVHLNKRFPGISIILIVLVTPDSSYGG